MTLEDILCSGVLFGRDMNIQQPEVLHCRQEIITAKGFTATLA